MSTANEHPTLTLAKALLARPSLTPKDAGCMDLIIEQLAPLGFRVQWINRGQTRNLWLTHGQGQPCVVFAGHTDVVPIGAADQWHFDPFTPTEHEGQLYARGAADMKSSVAAMVIACQRLVTESPDHPGTVALLITSDEEGKGTDGTRYACEVLAQQGVVMDFCIVGEPSSQSQLGDMIKNGRRGSLHGTLRVIGQQGHVAYPHLAKNPIHLAAPALLELVNTVWDEGSEDFPPTSFQITNLHSGTGADNVIPPDICLQFNFRYNPKSSVECLQARVHEAMQQAGLFPLDEDAEDNTSREESGSSAEAATESTSGVTSNTARKGQYTLDWWLSGEPFITPQGRLVQALSSAIQQQLGISPQCSTSGGTSDGRFIAKICPEVVEFGPINATIHQVNEHVSIADLAPLTEVYHHTLSALLNS